MDTRKQLKIMIVAEGIKYLRINLTKGYKTCKQKPEKYF